jgi:hypothetical protein
MRHLSVALEELIADNRIRRELSFGFATVRRNKLKRFMRRMCGACQWRIRDCGEIVPVVETAESWRRPDLRAQWRARRREMAGSVGWLHSKAPVRSAMVVGDVLADYTFGMAMVTDDASAGR